MGGLGKLTLVVIQVREGKTFSVASAVSRICIYQEYIYKFKGELRNTVFVTRFQF